MRNPIMSKISLTVKENVASNDTFSQIVKTIVNFLLSII